MSPLEPATGTGARARRHLDALAELEAPLAYVDLDAFDANGATLLREAGHHQIRVATKSVRCDALIDRALDSDARFHGAMAFTVDEALHLSARGITDVLIGYPASEPAALRRLAEWLADHPDQQIRPMVDGPAQLDLLGEAGRAAGTEIACCIDVDAGWRPAGSHGPTIGPKRSSLHTPEQVLEVVRHARRTEGVRVDALMAYDGQIAGVGDDPPGRPVRARAIRLMQGRSLADLRERVPRIVAAVQAELASEGGLAIVNVGGTGSLSRIAGLVPATELTAGSGFYAPTLFDAYRHLQLQPAAFFVLPVVRRPARRVATLLGGGYIASGAAGPDRVPQAVFPEGLRLDGDEGAGEVQTPVLGEAAEGLGIGARVVLRHAKAGELCERFDRLHLVGGGELRGDALTYRGAGHTFL
ncbi:MAG: alanine racemase [Solirubrobacteraceae bacterium]|nr:alanine racemase [Solirubrobacteraceae bacterium]